MTPHPDFFMAATGNRVHPEFANPSLCNSVSHAHANGNPQILGFCIDSHLRENDADIRKSGRLPADLRDRLLRGNRRPIGIRFLNIARNVLLPALLNPLVVIEIQLVIHDRPGIR